MTGIDFHFNLQDKLTYGCRLLRKAYARGAKLVVTGTLEQLTQLDALLWTFSSLEFVPHRLVTLPGDAASWQSTPVLLAESPEACPHRDVLVNLGLQAPQGFEHFERLIEVVTLADDDRLAARSRWKLYAERGYAVKTTTWRLLGLPYECARPAPPPQCAYADRGGAPRRCDASDQGVPDRDESLPA